MGDADWRRLAAEWFPQLAGTRLRQSSWPAIEPHRDYIAGQLKAGVTAATIHQRLTSEHGLGASVASVRRWIRANLPEDARRAQVTVLGDAPPAGEQAQIDYGRLGMWADPATGRPVYQELHPFKLTPRRTRPGLPIRQVGKGSMSRRGRARRAARRTQQ